MKAGRPMKVHFLFVLRKLIAWLFAVLSALLPSHLLVQAPQNERCLVPQEASRAEVPPSAAASSRPVEEAVATARQSQR